MLTDELSIMCLSGKVISDTYSNVTLDEICFITSVNILLSTDVCDADIWHTKVQRVLLRSSHEFEARYYCH